jgi:alkanesulfonate monooxygenase SsuD/methylene tetrahydromethanopterin reductase-like flavin-dependent oxidoreductase (luciferase family)
VAAEAERLGYEVLFANDHPGGDGLAMVAEWVKPSRRLDLGVGVLALDRHQPADIQARVDELEVPHPRLVLGIGAGFTDHPLGAVRAGVAAVREALPDVRIIVAAMGPKMCRLAGEVADGALLNWMTPERAGWARDLVREGASDAGKDAVNEVTIYGYVRVAMGPDAKERLKREASMYEQMPHYARHFEATGARPHEIGVTAKDAGDLREQLGQYLALDVPVLRVLSDRNVGAILAVAEAATG